MVLTGYISFSYFQGPKTIYDDVTSSSFPTNSKKIFLLFYISVSKYYLVINLYPLKKS